jgi:hypothetical protein
MVRRIVRSAVGNRILRFSGFFFAAAGAGLLIDLVMSSWGYASRVDYLFGLMLLATAGAGAYLAIACGESGSQGSVRSGERRTSPAGR